MLVSVAVITYNSSKTVIETLDSILKQSYGSKNIELIISDDASKDDTVKIVDKWIASHKDSFYKVTFIKNSINLGVSGNINTAWKAVSSEWVKSIAGDDILHTNCIELNIEYIKQNIDCKILFSKMQTFGRSNSVIPTSYDINFFNRGSYEQYNWLRTFSFNIAPSSFIQTSLLKEVEYADESHRMIEDLPLWLKITKLGYKLHFLNSITVYYRVDESVSLSNVNYINKTLIKDLINIYSEHQESFYKHPLVEWIMSEKILSYKLMLLLSNLSNNKKSIVTNIGEYVLKLLRPAHSARKIAIMLKQYNR